jgi:uncharacterized protein YbjQ (UPF0145 family)
VKSIIAPEAVVTFERLEGFAVSHSFGIVSGEAFLGRNILASTFRTIGTLIGLATADCLTDAERARGTALAQLRGNAELLGANGVVGLHFAASEQIDGSTRVVASGEAVLLDPAPQ